MGQEAVGKNLVRLRKAKGMTQVQLAEAAGISRGGYRNIEKGRALPRSGNIRALAQALDVKIKDLVVPPPELKHVRFRALKRVSRLKRRDQVLVEVGTWLRHYSNLEELLDARQRHSLGLLWRDARRKRKDRAAALAEKARVMFGLESREPVHDICGLLESEGIKVKSIDVASDAFFGLSVGEEDGGPAVVVNTWSRIPVEHWIFSAAHELGHLILHRPAYDVSQEQEEEDQEQEANAFASRFLMPDEVFAREWGETAGQALVDRVLKVKRVFRVSWRTVLYRVSEMLPRHRRADLWKRFHAAYSLQSGQRLHKHDEPDAVGVDQFSDPRVVRGGEPASLERHDFLGDRLSRLVRQAVEQGVITQARGAEILGLDLKAMRSLTASWWE